MGRCQVSILAGEVAVAMVDGKRRGGGSADAHRQIALPESCWSLRQLSPSPPQTLPPLPLPSVKHTQKIAAPTNQEAEGH